MEELERKAYEQQQQSLQLQASQLGLSAQGLQQEDAGMIKEQLSLGEELETLDHLIQSHTLVYNQEKQINEWLVPENEDLIILSDYGVHFFRQIIAAYINKNTLLSNYDDATIKQKMYDLATTINDEIFLSYEKIFKFPSIERCKREIEEDVKEKMEIRKFAAKLLGKDIDEDAEEKAIIEKMEYELERKIEKIRQKLFSNKLKRFSFILRFVQDAIHSSYLRAFGGQERRSIRAHTQVIENRGLTSPQQKPQGRLSSWLQRN